ncbi:MAG: sigma-54-dependent Fis family transcriptional regulator [Deltaproteobacteria bacterium]|nr:sigma-54-dependent Fis family transcriptional regulator [Deltaproteobacteria bacterium]
MQPAKILVADDEQNLRRVLVALLKREGHEVVQAATGLEAIEQLADVDIVITDLRMPGADGMEVLRAASRNHPHVPVIMITAYGSVGQAVEAIKAGAFDYIEKPFEQDAIRMIIAKAIGQAVANRSAPRPALYQGNDSRGKYGLVGTSAEMQQIFSIIERVADTPSTVLITGESGTGKELAAAAIHELGPRRGKPFVALNCAAIPEALLESELFGYAKGAFTGASRDKIGLMQAAHGGTLFLDEIGDMGPSLQVKVLRAFQQREIRRLGDDRAIPIDIRMVSATHRDLRALVAAGQLREDFFYRIRVFEIEMPPLRARPDDIPLLASHFAAELGKLSGKPNLAIASDAMQRLLEHDWPGNVRELRNAIEHAMVSAERATIRIADLPPELQHRASAAAIDREEIIPVDMRVAIDDALRRSGGNRTEAARLLGISRVTLWKRMRRLGHVVEDETD